MPKDIIILNYGDCKCKNCGAPLTLTEEEYRKGAKALQSVINACTSQLIEEYSKLIDLQTNSNKGIAKKHKKIRPYVIKI